MRVAKLFLITMSVLALNNCTTEYVLINKCPLVEASEWRTVSELYLEKVKYETAYNLCVKGEKK